MLVPLSPRPFVVVWKGCCRFAVLDREHEPEAMPCLNGARVE